MWRVVSCLNDQHDLSIVATAALICIVGSFFAFRLLDRARSSPAEQSWRWLLGAGVAGGSSVWATHFVAMIAYQGGLPVLFNTPLTALSAATAILFSFAGFGRALRDGPLNSVGAGAVLAAGIAVMHFTGMAAIEAPARLSYDYALIASGVVAAILLSCGAVAMFRAKLRYRTAFASGLFTLSICVAHFVSMSAMTLVPDPTVAFNAAAQSTGTVASEVAVVIVLLTAVLTIVMTRDAHRLTSLVNASLEGIVIVRGDRIVDINQQMLAFVQRKRSTVGQSLKDLLPALADDERLALRQTAKIELVVDNDAGTPVHFEITRREASVGGHAAEILIFRDLTEQRAAQARIEHLAHHDVLTDLPNRALFQDRLHHALATADFMNSKVALLTLDLDGFKAVNDFHGHAEGDALLRRVAALLTTVVRASDTVARLGGDEFAIVQSSIGQPDDAQLLAVRVLAAFAEHFANDHGGEGIGVSIGIALYPDDAREAEALLRKSDVALGRAKAAGKNGWYFYSNDMDAVVSERSLLVRELKASITHGELFLVYQPQADATSGAITGFEALVRWRHPVRGIVPPDVFIPLAEECGFIVQLGRWVMREACTAAAGWVAPLNIAVNISPLEFVRGNVAGDIEDVLRDTGLDPHRLEIEITESALVKDRDATLTVLHRLRAQGIRIAMDDFGTGYSSLSNLHAFPFDKIKIDRSFVSDLENDTAAGTIVRAIIGLGQGLRLPITAEGVETGSQLTMLRSENCSEVQGYFIGRPLDISAYADIVNGEPERRSGVVTPLNRPSQRPALAASSR